MPAPGQGHRWESYLREWVALCVYCSVLAMNTAVCVCGCVGGTLGGWGITTDVLALSSLYMKIISALEESLSTD